MAKRWDEQAARDFEEVQRRHAEVIEHRRQALVERDCPERLAEELARRTDIDLETMRRMLEGGCSPETLAAIVR